MSIASPSVHTCRNLGSHKYRSPPKGHLVGRDEKWCEGRTCRQAPRGSKTYTCFFLYFTPLHPTSPTPYFPLRNKTIETPAQLSICLSTNLPPYHTRLLSFNLASLGPIHTYSTALKPKPKPKHKSYKILAPSLTLRDLEHWIHQCRTTD